MNIHLCVMACALTLLSASAPAAARGNSTMYPPAVRGSVVDDYHGTREAAGDTRVVTEAKSRLKPREPAVRDEQGKHDERD